MEYNVNEAWEEDTLKNNNIIDFESYSSKKRKKNELKKRANGEIIVDEARKKEIRVQLREKLRNKDRE